MNRLINVTFRAPALSKAFSRAANGSVVPRVRISQRLSQCRCYAQQASKPTRAEEALKQLAKNAARNSKQTELPEKLLIYHGGTIRITFIAIVKLTSLFVGAFFCGIVVPTYVKSDKPVWDTAQVALAGVVAPLFVTFTTSAFVAYIHVHLPNQARASRGVLERLVRSPGGLPPSTKLTFTTMSFIGKARVSTVQAGDLTPVHQRFGIVNLVRSAASADEDNARRKWYMFPAVRRFYVQQGRPGVRPRVRYADKKTDKVEWWIWEAIKAKLDSRAARAAAPSSGGI